VTGWPRLPWAFPWVLAVCEEAWRQRAIAGIEDPPPYVTAVAVMWGVDIQTLAWHVEAKHGWEPHNAGYTQAVWAALWCNDHGGPIPPARDRIVPKSELVDAVGRPWLMGGWRSLGGTMGRTTWEGVTGDGMVPIRVVDTGEPPPTVVPTGAITLQGDDIVGPWRYLGRRR